MTLSEARQVLDRIHSLNSHGRDLELVVRVVDPGRVGGAPCAAIESIHAGFDWDAGKVIMMASRPLTLLSADDVSAINKSVAQGQSWHAYQQHRKMKDRIRELEQRIAELESAASA